MAINTLMHVTRQSGSTIRLQQVFNPTTDLYVSFNNNVTEMFAAKYSYPINCINLHNGRLDDMIMTMVDANIETVYIDVGPSSFFDGRNVIHRFIRKYDEYAEKKGIKPFFVIV